LGSANDCVLSISAAEPKRKHISKTLAPLVASGQLITDTDKTVRPFRLVVSKQTPSSAVKLEQIAAQQGKDATLLNQMKELLDGALSAEAETKRAKLQ
jgi:hypothetical protein